MAISKRLRYEILARDNNTCRYCHATDTPLHIDHVTPTALAGTDDPANLVAACKDCNSGKSSSHPDAALVAEVSDDAIRWSAAMQLAADRLAANKAAATEQLKPWFDDWYVWSGPGWSYKLPADADEVLTRYLAAGMPLDVLREAAQIALRKRNCDGYFRYFQGVANNWLHDLQRDASAILAADQSAPPSYSEGKDKKWWYRRGLLDCCMLADADDTGHPDHYQMRALSQVVDHVSNDCIPFYSGRIERI